MSIHLQRFVDRVRAQEARGARDFSMSMSDAKDLHADITRLLIELQTFKEAITVKSAPEPNITVQIEGGTFK